MSSKKTKAYGEAESDWHHPTYTPQWLGRTPSEGARYCVINGVAFETMAGTYFGYFIDRITMGGDYLGETHWCEKWSDAKKAMEDWDNRPTNYLGDYEVEDVYGNDDGSPTPVAKAKLSRMQSNRHAVLKNRAAAKARKQVNA